MDEEGLLEEMRRRLYKLVGRQTDLSRATGISQPKISKILRHQNPSAVQIYLIARACGTTVERLFGEPNGDAGAVPTTPDALSDGERRVVELMRLFRIDPDDALRALASLVQSGPRKGASRKGLGLRGRVKGVERRDPEGQD
jgi:transcriptional regulator with XRE-family HTH domain